MSEPKKAYYRVTLDHLVSGTGRPETFNMPDNLQLDSTGNHFSFCQANIGPVFSYHKDTVLKIERIEEESDGSAQDDSPA